MACQTGCKFTSNLYFIIRWPDSTFIGIDSLETSQLPELLASSSNGCVRNSWTRSVKTGISLDSPSLPFSELTFVMIWSAGAKLGSGTIIFQRIALGVPASTFVDREVEP